MQQSCEYLLRKHCFLRKEFRSESFRSRQQCRSGPESSEKEAPREGLFREIKRRRAYEKPSEKRVRENREGIPQGKKAARKLAQREGLLPNVRPKNPALFGRG